MITLEDHAILALCAEFDVLSHKRRALFDTITDDREREPAIRAIDAEQEPLLHRLSALRATGIEAHRARARSLSRYLGTEQLEEDAASSSWPDRLTAAIVRDLAAVQLCVMGNIVSIETGLPIAKAVPRTSGAEPESNPGQFVAVFKELAEQWAVWRPPSARKSARRHLQIVPPPPDLPD